MDSAFIEAAKQVPTLFLLIMFMIGVLKWITKVQESHSKEQREANERHTTQIMGLQENHERQVQTQNEAHERRLTEQQNAHATKLLKVLDDYRKDRGETEKHLERSEQTFSKVLTTLGELKGLAAKRDG